MHFFDLAECILPGLPLGIVFGFRTRPARRMHFDHNLSSARAPRTRRMHSDWLAFGDWVWVLRARPARAECISILIYVLRARPARAECILLGLPLGIGFGFCARAPRSGNGLDGGGGGGGVETARQSNVRISSDTGLPYQT